MDLRRVQLLRGNECRDVRATVADLRAAWHEVRPGFFTLGSPVYQHADNLSEYRRLAALERSLLWNHFSALYRKLYAALEDHVAAPIHVLPQAALPGFHIFAYTGQEVFDGGAHFDLSYLALETLYRVTFERAWHVSYTLALELPAEGSGLELFPVCYDGDPSLDARSYELLAGQNRGFYHAYHPGELCLFSGHWLHRISLHGASPRAGHRITLQGHLIRSQGKWITYW